MQASHTENPFNHLGLEPILLRAVYGLGYEGDPALVDEQVIAATQSTHVLSSPKLGKSIGFFADYSFSLYLVHYTIMYAVWTISSSRGIIVFATAVLVSNLVAIGLAEIGEKNHRRIARSLNQKLLAAKATL